MNVHGASWLSGMKAGEEHRALLALASMSVLERAQALDNGCGLVFASPMRRAHPLSDMTLTKLLCKAGMDNCATVQG